MDIGEFKSTGRVDGNIIIIANERIQNNFKTEEQGIPVFEDIPFVRIITPSAKNQEVHRKLNAGDKIKYKEVWEAFDKKEAHKAAGTPLSQWPEMEIGLIPVYEHNHVYTVEDFAEVSEANLGNLGMGSSGLQLKAKKFLEGKSESDIVLEKAMVRIEELEQLVNELTGAKELANPAVSEMEKQDELINVSTG
ncbi:hypothetical protein OAF54_00860 [bacterium]|nr:hypothetical protein [bacterium]